MSRVLHLYDAQLSPSALTQMTLVHGLRAGNVLARVGAAEDRPELPEPDEAVRLIWGFTLSSAPEVRALAQRRDVDAIHCWSPALADVAASCGRPTVVSLYRPPSPADAKEVRSATQHGARVVAPSAALADELQNMDLREQAIVVIPPAAQPVDRRPETRRAARCRLGLTEAHWVLLCPWQERYGEAWMWSIWGMGVMRQMLEQVRLIVAGVGRIERTTADLACQAGFRAETIIPGRSASIPTLWAAADVALLCEGDGYGATELAQAVVAGVPVIAGRAGELQALLADGVTALFHKPKDPRTLSQTLWQLHSQVGLAERLAANAAALAESFCPAALLRRLDELYAG